MSSALPPPTTSSFLAVHTKFRYLFSIETSTYVHTRMHTCASSSRLMFAAYVCL